MAFEFYTPGQQFQPDWVHAWSPQAFRQLYADTGFDPGSMSASDLRDGGDYNIRNKFYDYLAGKGMKLGLDSKGQYGKYQVFDQAGNAVGKGEDFNSGGMEILTPLLLAGGVAGLQAMGYLGGAGAAAEGAGAALGGTGAAGAGEAGIGTLGAGGSTAGQFVAQPLTVLGPNGGLSAASAASIPTAASQGFGAGSLDYLLGSGIAGAGAGAAAGGSSATKAALYGAEGYGPGMTGGQTAIYDKALEWTGSKTLADLAANNPVTSTLSDLLHPNSLKEFAQNPLVQVGGTLLGGIAGAKSAGAEQVASRESKMDPRMEQYVYGSGYGDPNSLLGAAQALWRQNPNGINPLMQQGLDMATSALTNPAYSQSYTNMRDLGNSLMSGGVAGNPFTSGMAQLGGMPQMGQQMPQLQQEPRAYAGGTAGFDERMGFQNQPQPQQMDRAQEAAQLGGGGGQMTDLMRRIIGGAQARAGGAPAAMAAGDFDPQLGRGLLGAASNTGVVPPSYGLLSDPSSSALQASAPNLNQGPSGQMGLLGLRRSPLPASRGLL